MSNCHPLPGRESVDVTSVTTPMSSSETLEAISDYKNCVDVKSEVVRGDEEEATTNSRMIDTGQAEKHLGLIGFPKGQPFLIFQWGGKRDGLHVPSLSIVKQWKDVEQWHLDNDIWQHVNDSIAKFGGSVGIRPSPGGSKQDDVFEVRTLVYEIDPPKPQDFSAKQQQEVWKWAGLPEPTVMVFTGNKSVHCYYTLKKPCAPEDGQQGRKRLSRAIDDALVAKGFSHLKTDQSICKPNQPLRLAGSVHPKTGKRAEIVGGCEKQYDLDEILDCCPEIEIVKSADIEGSGEDFSIRPLPESEVEDPKERFPTPKEIGVLIPLELTVGDKINKLIVEGLPEDDDDRWRTYHRLEKHLRAGRLHAESLGFSVKYDDTQGCVGYGQDAVMAALDDFVRRSKIKGGDVDAAQEAHYRPDEPCGETDHCTLYLLRRIKKWARVNRIWFAPLQTYSFKFKQDKTYSWESAIGEEFWEVSPQTTPETIVANAFLLRAEATGKHLVFHQGRFNEYDEKQGCYTFKSQLEMEREIASQILPLLWTQKGRGRQRKYARNNSVKPVVEWLAKINHVDEMDLVPAIAFQNGTYLTKSKEFVAHDSKYRLSYSIQGEYRAQSECPAVMRSYIEASFGSDWVEVIRCVIRYLIDQSTFSARKFVVLIGDSGSGKGVFQRLCSKMFPPTCVSEITSDIRLINTPEKVQQFVIGRRLIAFPDIQGYQTGVTTLYSLVDGGGLPSRVLHASEGCNEPFTGRVIICSSQPLQLENAGSGMARRQLVLKTQPAPLKPDPDLVRKLQVEIGDIVSWALGAAESEVEDVLSGNNQLVREAAEEVEKDMDTVRRFIDQCLVVASGEIMPSDTKVYDVFRDFCKATGLEKPCALNQFKRRLRQALPHLNAKRKNIGNGKKTSEQLFGFDINKTIKDAYLANNTYESCEELEGGGWSQLKGHHPPEPTSEQIASHQRSKCSSLTPGQVKTRRDTAWTRWE